MGIIESPGPVNVTFQVTTYGNGRYEALRMGNFAVATLPWSSPPAYVEDYGGGRLISDSEEVRTIVDDGVVSLDDLPPAEFAFPGPLRDRLVAAILAGTKTSTSGLVLFHERDDEPLPEVGHLSAVLDSAGRRVAVIELTEVRVVRLADVDLRHALDEGEGDESVAQWRASHEEFWHSAQVRAELGDPGFTVDDETLVLAKRFRLVHTADQPSERGERAG